MLLLHTYAELTPDEIAEALGISTGSVRKRLHRARRFMAERLGLNGNEEDETVPTANTGALTQAMTQIDELLRQTANAVERDAEAERRAIGRAQRALSAAIAAEATQDRPRANRQRRSGTRLPRRATGLAYPRWSLSGRPSRSPSRGAQDPADPQWPTPPSSITSAQN